MNEEPTARRGEPTHVGPERLKTRIISTVARRGRTITSFAIDDLMRKQDKAAIIWTELLGMTQGKEKNVIIQLIR